MINRPNCLSKDKLDYWCDINVVVVVMTLDSPTTTPATAVCTVAVMRGWVVASPAPEVAALTVATSYYQHRDIRHMLYCYLLSSHDLYLILQPGISWGTRSNHPRCLSTLQFMDHGSWTVSGLNCRWVAKIQGVSKIFEQQYWVFRLKMHQFLSWIIHF